MDKVENNHMNKLRRKVGKTAQKKKLPFKIAENVVSKFSFVKFSNPNGCCLIIFLFHDFLMVKQFLPTLPLWL